MFGDKSDNKKKFFMNLAGADNDDETFENDLSIVDSAELASVKSSKTKKKDEEKNNKDSEVVEINSNELLDNDDEIEGQLTIDVYQDENHIYIESPVAGVTPEDLDISITPESVSIRGKRSRQKRVEERDYLYQECFWGSFSRSVILPQEIDPDRASASLKNGVLKISLPKINRLKSKKIKVKVD